MRELSIRVPDDQYERVKAAAAKDSRTISSYVRAAVAERLRREGKRGDAESD